MYEQIGKFHVEYPIWFLAESAVSHEKGKNAMGIRGQTGFMMLTLFTGKDLAERFVEEEHLKNVVIMRIDSAQYFSDLLKTSSENFTHLTFNPLSNQAASRTRSSITLEYVLTALSEEN